MRSLTLPQAKYFFPQLQNSPTTSLCVLSKNPNKLLPATLYSFSETWHARNCLCFLSLSLFAFLCTTKADCVSTYKEPKYFKYWLLQKYETPFLVLGSNRGIKGERKRHFPALQHWAWLFAVSLPFQIPYCNYRKTIPPLLFCPRESQAWLPMQSWQPHTFSLINLPA